MNAKEYNKHHWKNVTYEDVEKLLINNCTTFESLVTEYQVSVNLASDGKLGPKTRAKLNQFNERFIDSFIKKVRNQILQGEVGSNNAGPFIELMLSDLGWGHLAGKKAPWCATLLSWALYSLTKSRQALGSGAWRLANDLLLTGRGTEVGIADVQPGDIVQWGDITKGHIGMIDWVQDDGTVVTIEGNVGRFPAKVKRLTHDLARNTPRVIVRLNF